MVKFFDSSEGVRRRRRSMKSKVLAMAVSFAMLVTMIPSIAFADTQGQVAKKSAGVSAQDDPVRDAAYYQGIYDKLNASYNALSSKAKSETNDDDTIVYAEAIQDKLIEFLAKINTADTGLSALEQKVTESNTALEAAQAEVAKYVAGEITLSRGEVSAVDNANVQADYTFTVVGGGPEWKKLIGADTQTTITKTVTWNSNSVSDTWPAYTVLATAFANDNVTSWVNYCALTTNSNANGDFENLALNLSGYRDSLNNNTSFSNIDSFYESINDGTSYITARNTARDAASAAQTAVDSVVGAVTTCKLELDTLRTEIDYLFGEIDRAMLADYKDDFTTLMENYAALVSDFDDSVAELLEKSPLIKDIKARIEAVQAEFDKLDVLEEDEITIRGMINEATAAVAAAQEEVDKFEPGSVVLTRDSSSYNDTQIIDPEDPDYGKVSVSYTFRISGGGEKWREEMGVPSTETGDYVIDKVVKWHSTETAFTGFPSYNTVATAFENAKYCDYYAVKASVNSDNGNVDSVVCYMRTYKNSNNLNANTNETLEDVLDRAVYGNDFKSGRTGAEDDWSAASAEQLVAQNALEDKIAEIEDQCDKVGTAIYELDQKIKDTLEDDAFASIKTAIEAKATALNVDTMNITLAPVGEAKITALDGKVQYAPAGDAKDLFDFIKEFGIAPTYKFHNQSSSTFEVNATSGALTLKAGVDQSANRVYGDVSVELKFAANATGNAPIDNLLIGYTANTVHTGNVEIALSLDRTALAALIAAANEKVTEANAAVEAAKAKIVGIKADPDNLSTAKLAAIADYESKFEAVTAAAIALNAAVETAKEAHDLDDTATTQLALNNAKAALNSAIADPALQTAMTALSASGTALDNALPKQVAVYTGSNPKNIKIYKGEALPALNDSFAGEFKTTDRSAVVSGTVAWVATSVTDSGRQSVTFTPDGTAAADYKTHTYQDVLNVTVLDKSELDSVIGHAEAFILDVADEYVVGDAPGQIKQSLWDAFMNAIEAAKAVSDKLANANNQTDIDAAVTALRAAFVDFSKNVPLNRDALNAATAAAVTAIGDAAAAIDAANAKIAALDRGQLTKAQRDLLDRYIAARDAAIAAKNAMSKKYEEVLASLPASGVTQGHLDSVTEDLTDKNGDFQKATNATDGALKTLQSAGTTLDSAIATGNPPAKQELVKVKVPDVQKMRTALKTIYLKAKDKKLYTLHYVLDTVGGKAIKDSGLKATSSNSKIAKVWYQGTSLKIAGLAKGTATITLKAQNGKTFKVKVVVVSKAVNLKSFSVKAPKSLKKGKTYQMTVSKLTKKATDVYRVKFASSNKKVLTVDSVGKITALKKGTAKITVTAGTKKVVRTITVK